MALKIRKHTQNNINSNSPDEELISAYKQKDNKEAFGILYKRYAHLVLGTCIKYLKNEDDAQDAVMQIFEKLLIDLKSQEISFFKSWLYMVSKNFCLMQIRKDSTFDKIKTGFAAENKENFMESPKEVHLNIEDNFTNEKIIQRAIEKLSEEQRICIELFYLKEKSYAEIVEISGYDLKKVKSYIQNGKRNLKLILEKDP